MLLAWFNCWRFEYVSLCRGLQSHLQCERFLIQSRVKMPLWAIFLLDVDDVFNPTMFVMMRATLTSGLFIVDLAAFEFLTPTKYEYNNGPIYVSSSSAYQHAIQLHLLWFCALLKVFTTLSLQIRLLSIWPTSLACHEDLCLVSKTQNCDNLFKLIIDHTMECHGFEFTIRPVSCQKRSWQYKLRSPWFAHQSVTTVTCAIIVHEHPFFDGPCVHLRRMLWVICFFYYFRDVSLLHDYFFWLHEMLIFICVVANYTNKSISASMTVQLVTTDYVMLMMLVRIFTFLQLSLNIHSNCRR